MRLDKYLTECLLITRSEAKNLIKKNKVTVNGNVEKDPGRKIDPATDQVMAEGKLYSYEEFHYYMLHKPAGVVTATADSRDRTVMDLISIKNKKLFPVGRLDKDTEGLLLITDDGEMAHRLLAPGRHVDKCYLAKITEPITDEDIVLFKEGMDIGEKKKTMPAILRAADDNLYAYITIREGKFHQVKRMFHAIGKEVLYLKRISMGPLILDENLKKGEFRELSKEELDRLQEITNG